MAYQQSTARAAPEEFALAKADTKVSLSGFASAVGVADPQKLYPKLNALLVEVEAESKAVVDAAEPSLGAPAAQRGRVRRGFPEPVEP